MLPDTTETEPLVVVLHGVPSLNTNDENVSAEDVTGSPITLKLKLTSVPDPCNSVEPKTEIFRVPAVEVFTVKTRPPPLDDPTVPRVAPENVSTESLNVRVRSTDFAPRPIGSVMFTGTETETPVLEDGLGIVTPTQGSEATPTVANAITHTAIKKILMAHLLLEEWFGLLADDIEPPDFKCLDRGAKAF
jgi:hypothetical protein